MPDMRMQCPPSRKPGRARSSHLRRSWRHEHGRGTTGSSSVPLHRSGCRAVRTAPSWRGILPFTHLAREGRMTVTIGRRELLAALGGAAVACPLAARAQSNLRHIGVLMGWSQSDPYQSWLAAFVQELTRLGWRLAVNVRIDERWTYGDIRRAQAFAKELVGMRPDVIVAGTTPVTAALHRETPTIPIVFAVVSDRVGAGCVGKLSQPAGNITGFINMEAAMGGKWLGLLKEIAPQIRRAAIMFNPDTAPGGGSYFLDSFEAAARSLAIEPVTARVR